MELNRNDSSIDIIERNSADISKLIESKCMKPLEIKPTDYKHEEFTANWYFVQGYAQRTKGDFDAAISQYRLGLKHDPEHTGIKLNLGVCLMKIGLIQRALEIFNEIDIEAAYINSGICCITIKKYYEAANYINKALQLKQLPAYYQLLSLALFRAGKIGEALEVFKDVNPSEAIIEDERVLRNNKNPQIKFPFKVGEIDSFLFKTRDKHAKSKSSSVYSVETTNRSYKSPKLYSTPSKVDHRRSVSISKPVEFDYKPKSKPNLPVYDHIITKKIELDRMIKKRHESLIENLTNYLPAFKYQGFIQQKLETAPESMYQEPSSDKGIKKKIEKMQNEMKKNLIKYEHNDIISKDINEQTLKILDEEFCKDTSARNYGILETILKNLVFFSKFPFEIRMKLIKASVFKKYESDEIIIKQGEAGDSMFVILRGSIKIVKSSPEFGNLKLTINSMYDGETFGELALLSEGINNIIKRSATCIAGENTKLLAISREDYKSILLDQMQDNIVSKVNFFQTLPYFEGFSNISLIPIASNLDPVDYKIDQKIIQLGEKPKGLYIIFKGRCNLYWEGYVAKPTKPELTTNIKIRPKSPKPYYTGIIMPEFSRKTSTKKNHSIDPSDFEKAKPYLPSDLKGKNIYKELILCKPLREGDCFGGRALLEGIINMNKHDEDEKTVKFEFIQCTPAKFTVVAESSDVKVFILTRKHFPLLSEEIIVKNI